MNITQNAIDVKSNTKFDHLKEILHNENITTQENIENAIFSILKNIETDPKREGLIDTPKRVAKSYAEIFSGYHINFDEIYKAKFQNEYKSNQNLILIKDIEYKSMCEHHMLPVIGVAHIAYIPTDLILGLSKFARIVNAFANRLQLQERMTAQIAKNIIENLSPAGVAVSLSASHYCMIMRGVKQSASVKTFYFDGIFKDIEYQNKFLSLI